jgi:hypothetical protein
MDPGQSEGRPGNKAATTTTLDPADTVAPTADGNDRAGPHQLPPCVCGIDLCDRPDPYACPVHAVLHQMVCRGGESTVDGGG